MHLYTTDVDKHLELLENASGDIHFFHYRDKPATVCEVCCQRRRAVATATEMPLYFQSKGSAFQEGASRHARHRRST